jgi:superfamily II DNA or RNA helicase
MATFSEFLSSFDPNAGKRGKQFEHFIKWFLKNDPEWATQVDQVWLWEEYPQNWGRDCGIDLVFKHKNGENWAVQAKCYAPNTSITKADVDSFISESNRDGIDKLLLIASTDLIGANAKQVCDAQDKKVTRYLLSHFDESNIEYPTSIEDLSKAKPKDKPKPREHQLEAIESVTSNFKDTDRGQMIMACGTGKTFTTLWIKEKLGVDSTLVLLPSLGLLSQTLHEWTMAANETFEVLCVCSDESVGKKGADEAVHSVHDLAFPVTSNSAEIKVFLNRSGKKVIFSTYQSSPLIAEAQADPLTSPFDLAIADEAHRCAGKVSGDFSTILDAQKIRAKKRLFTTATPRTYSSNVKKTAEDRGIEVVGMDDEAVFGKQLFALNFGEAIKRGLLTDYRVVIIGVDDPTISEWIENRELLQADSDIEMDAESLAAQVGLLKAIKDYDLRRMISFHSRVSRAEEFSKDIHKVIDWIDEKHKPSGELKSDFVSGEMPTDKRRKKLAQLKGLQDNQRGLLTNAKCLSEGVDVPSLDGVAFIDPRSSQIDIIQAVGRAIRLSTNKQAGTIVLPVFIGNTDDPEQVLKGSNFKPIWDVLIALKSHDDVLANELNQMRTGMGKRGSSKVVGSFSKILIDLPTTITPTFSDSIKTYLVENATESWEFWFNLMNRYSNEFGDCLIPAKGTYQGFKLGSWVNGQRTSRDNISPLRKNKLESIKGWTWTARPIWIPFEEARNYVRSLNLKNVKEWKKFAKSEQRPAGIPYIPERTFPDEWVSYADWLGSENTRRKNGKFLPFNEAQKIVRKLNLKTSTNWEKFAKSEEFPLNIPKDPSKHYASQGWSGFHDFLNDPNDVKSFEEAKRLAQQVSKDLNITGMSEWEALGQRGELPYDLPTYPYRYYENEWIDWFDWFGKPNTRDKEYLPFIEARDFVRKLNLKTQSEWNKFLKQKIKPDNIPYHPERAYKNKGWNGWRDWLQSPS